jgi:DNA polymerase-3 subunit gamma/tau
MSYLVLARKWRPQTFEEIRGQEHIARALRNAISSGRIAHAYVFTGIRGVGKTSAARVLAKALNCAQGPTPTPCNTCPSCREITEGRSSDVLEIDGASNTGVEDVRRLREAVRYPPVRGPYRVYIIDEVHMLSTAAFNALLKTLEEPPEHVVFVLATTDPHKIPVTILSRCQQFDFKRLTHRELGRLLGDVARAEGVAIDEKSLASLAREADGSVRDGQSLLDQVISYAGEQVAYEDVRDVLGVVDRDLVLGVARAVIERDPRRVVESLAAAERFGYDVRRFGHDLLDAFRDLAVLRAVPEAEDLVDLSAEEIGEARAFLGETSWEEVHALFDMLSRGVDSLRGAARPGPVLEMTLLKMAKLPPLIALSEVLARLPGSGGEPTGQLPKGEPGVPQARGAAPGARRQAPGAAMAPEPPPSKPEVASAGAAPAAAPSQPGSRTSSPTPLPSETVAPMDGPRLWDALLRSAEVSNRPFWNVLRAHGRLAAWDPAGPVGTLTLDDVGHEFFVRSKAELLARLVQEVAGPGARMDVNCDRVAEAARGNPKESDRARSAKREVLEHPLVRDAMELFDGDVEEVRVPKP